ncbi:hypothetical protein FRC07_001663, partial [Ceratobasidium sp. 392]
MASKDLRDARANLRNLPRFNDDLDPVREVEWRRDFLIATRDVTDRERAQLWADHLVFEGVAFDWLETIKSSAAGLADSKDWSKLMIRIEQRWPTPVRDPLALAEQKRLRWDESTLRVEAMLADLLNHSNPVKPQETWAKQHFSKGRNVGYSDDLLVHLTVRRALPSWVVPMLPKKAKYGSDFDKLCKDIGQLASQELYSGHWLNKAAEAMQGLTLNTPDEPPSARVPVPATSPFPSSLRRSSASPALAPSTPLSRSSPTSTLASNQPTARAQVSFAPQTVPQTPDRGQASRDKPPHMPQTTAGPAPQTPQTRPLRDPFPPLVAENTAEQRAHYSGQVKAWEVKYGE